jgi:hypothetical protein
VRRSRSSRSGSRSPPHRRQPLRSTFTSHLLLYAGAAPRSRETGGVLCYINNRTTCARPQPAVWSET